MARKCAIDGLANQAVNAGKKRRKRLAGPRRGGDQDVSALDDVGPALFLWFRRRTKPFHKPVVYQRVRPGKRLFLGSHMVILTRLIQ